ncbi:unnamed protein product [Boreogadus saida]
MAQCSTAEWAQPGSSRDKDAWSSRLGAPQATKKEFQRHSYQISEIESTPYSCHSNWGFPERTVREQKPDFNNVIQETQSTVRGIASQAEVWGPRQRAAVRVTALDRAPGPQPKQNKHATVVSSRYKGSSSTAD